MTNNTNNSDMQRYSVISKKNPREIVLLRGSGCKWRRCRFCDYHLDFSKDENANSALNEEVLTKVTGRFGILEVINSGSFCDLNDYTMKKIRQICREKNIRQIHFECHWKDRSHIAALRRFFSEIGTGVKVKIGVETFDYLFRESYLNKGIDEENPAAIAQDFNECCLLFGIPGQSTTSMQQDIETGLSHFERVCINIMVKNSTPILPDPRVRMSFIKELMPLYINNPRVDILIENTDFGVGGECRESGCFGGEQNVK